MVKVGRIGAIALLAMLAGGGAAARQAVPHVAPVPVPRMPIPVSALLPATQAVLDAAVRSGAVPGAVVSVVFIPIRNGKG